MRHPILGILRNLFSAPISLVHLSIKAYRKIEFLSKLSTECVRMYRTRSVWRGGKGLLQDCFYKDCFSYDDEELKRVLIANNNDETPSQSFHNSKCNCYFREKLSSAKNDLPLFSNGSCLICHRWPGSFWLLLFKQNLDFWRHARVVWVGQCSLGLIKSFGLMQWYIPLYKCNIFPTQSLLTVQATFYDNIKVG